MRQHLLSIIYYPLSIICRPRRLGPLSIICRAAPQPLCGKRSRAAFTLVELLTVMLIICLLAAAMGLSVRRAREHARRVKAETECRELVNAWVQYHDFYKGDWPGKGEVNATKEILAPLTDASANDGGIIFLNLSLAGGVWNDPWGNPYHIFFPDGSGTVTHETVLKTSVSYPFRRLGD